MNLTLSRGTPVDIIEVLCDFGVVIDTVCELAVELLLRSIRPDGC
jgi:hypothetical protein